MAASRFLVTAARCLCLAIGATAIVQSAASNVHAQAADPLFAAIEDRVTSVVESAERSVVAISRIPFAQPLLDREPVRNPFGPMPGFDSHDPLSAGFVPREFGTGIVIASPSDPNRRFVLTNYHVVKGGQTFLNDGRFRADSRLVVRFSRETAAFASIYAADPRSDLAVLTFELDQTGLTAADLPALPLTRARDVRKGQFAISLGNPYAIARDGSPSVSLGLISNVSRFPFAETPADKKTIHHFGLLLHVDTRLGPGASGGALLNGQGELIGITTSLAALEGYESSVGYAIPINDTTRRYIGDLTHGYEVEYGFLGVEVGRPQRERAQTGSVVRDIAGVRVDRVLSDSPAQQAGLRMADLILEINGAPIRSRDDLFREIGIVAPGEAARLRVVRDGRERGVEVVVGKWPVGDESDIITSADRYPVWRGIHVDWPSARSRYFDEKSPYPLAVLVNLVDSGSPAESAEIEDGTLISQVNGQPVRSPSDFVNAVKGQSGSVTLTRLDGGQVTVKP